MRSVRNRPRFDHVFCLATILVACAQGGPVALTGLGATDTAGGSGGQSDTELGGETSAESGGSNGTGGSSSRATQGGTTSDTGQASNAGGSTAKGGSSSAATGGSKAATSATGGRTSGGSTAQTGGAATSGGAVGSATSSSNATGGVVATGGTRATGGAVATGGAPASGGGQTTSPVIGTFPCNASNSTAAVTDMPFAVTVDSCFSWTKPATGVFRVGNWSGGSVTVQVADSTGAVFSDKTVPSGDWTSISGVAAGAIYLNVTAVAAGSSAQIKLNAF